MRASFMWIAGFLLTTVGMAANADDSITIHYDLVASQYLTFHYLGDTESNYAVPFTGYLNGNAGNKFNVYCIDLTHGQYNDTTQTVKTSQINQNSTVTTVNPTVTSAQLKEASWLIDKYNTTPLSGSDQQAALQLAIWSVVAGDTGFHAGYSLGSGGQNFYIDPNSLASGHGDILTLANADLIALGTDLAAGGGGGNGTLYALDPALGRITNSGQNVLADGSWSGQNITTDFNPTPEGNSVALLAFGAVPLLGTFWFKRRNCTSKHPVA